MANAYFVLVIEDEKRQQQLVYTLSGTHYGQLLLIFTQPHGELERFKQYATQTLKAGYRIGTTVVVADELQQVNDELQKRSLVPAGSNRVAVEGSPLFDEVIAQLLTDTIWAD